MFFNSFTIQLDDSTPNKKILFCFDFTGVAKPTIQAYVNGIYAGCSQKVKNGAVIIEESEYPQYFTQGAFLEVYLTNTQTHQEIRSETRSFFVVWKSATTDGWNPSPITYVTDSNTNKSMMLPPVAKSKGKMYHFKYFGTKRPFILMSSLKDRPYPLERSEVFLCAKESYEELFESTIEGTWKYILQHEYQSVSVVSDGKSWLVVNNYEGTFPSIGKGAMPANHMVEKEKSHFLNYYWTNDLSNNIVVTDLRENALKFIHVHRFLPDTGILRIWGPEGVGIEGVECSGTERAYLSISLSNRLLMTNTCSLILSYFKKKLCILAYYDGAGFRPEEYIEGKDSIRIDSSLTIATDGSRFKLPGLASSKQETKFYLIKAKTEGVFTIAAAEEGQMNLYTPKNGLRDCISYSKPLKKFCFWILMYVDRQMGGQTTAIVMNKYAEE